MEEKFYSCDAKYCGEQHKKGELYGITSPFSWLKGTVFLPQHYRIGDEYSIEWNACSIECAIKVQLQIAEKLKLAYKLSDEEINKGRR